MTNWHWLSSAMTVLHFIPGRGPEKTAKRLAISVCVVVAIGKKPTGKLWKNTRKGGEESVSTAIKYTRRKKAAV